MNSHLPRDCNLSAAASIEDREAMADLWVASWSAILPDIDFTARRAWLLARFETVPQLVVAKDGAGCILGFALYDATSGWLDQIAVALDALGGGVAHRLMTSVKSACPNGVRLDVNVDNPRAVAFYLREGFRQTGEGTNPSSGLRTLSMQWTR
ncbi:MAG: GCN5-related N-acetyltransferase [Hyphomicrobiales bacterium]|nr:GCN5-related N-acetyltransferase [Hyphomicrobiales bacterium]